MVSLARGGARRAYAYAMLEYVQRDSLDVAVCMSAPARSRCELKLSSLKRRLAGPNGSVVWTGHCLGVCGSVFCILDEYNRVIFCATRRTRVHDHEYTSTHLHSSVALAFSLPFQHPYPSTPALHATRCRPDTPAAAFAYAIPPTLLILTSTSLGI